MGTFVTGGTGFLGRYLVQGLLDAGEDLVLLIRGQDARQAQVKVRGALRRLGGPDDRNLDERIHVCLGRLDVPGLGLSPEDRDHILSRCDQFIHCGAATRFDLTLERARAVNVGGTESVLELAARRQRSDGLTRFDYISTAFVAGNRTDKVLEDELHPYLGHKNTYERTKFEAERMVRSAAESMPVTIYRPSIVVGNSRGGHTAHFKSFYWPAKVFALGLWRIAPARDETTLDLVPVDFVRDAILHIRSKPESLNGCFHLAAGPKGAVTFGEMARIFETFFPNRRPVKIVDPDRWLRYTQPVLRLFAVGWLRPVIRALELYIPYFSGNPSFDNSRAMEILADSGIEPPDVRSYVTDLLRFASDAGWKEEGRSD